MTVSTTCMDRVFTSRKRLEGTRFSLPDSQRCARYSLTEGAETDDEILRAEFDDVRNNDRQRNARAEWGQTGYMILSALMQLKYPADILERRITAGSPSHNPMWLYGAMMGCLAAYLQESATHHPFAQYGQSLCWAWVYWLHCAELREWDALELIEDTCTAFENKHAPGWMLSSVQRAEALELRSQIATEEPDCWDNPEGLELHIAGRAYTCGHVSEIAQAMGAWAMQQPVTLPDGVQVHPKQLYAAAAAALKLLPDFPHSKPLADLHGPLARRLEDGIACNGEAAALANWAVGWLQMNGIHRG